MNQAPLPCSASEGISRRMFVLAVSTECVGCWLWSFARRCIALRSATITPCMQSGSARIAPCIRTTQLHAYQKNSCEKLAPSAMCDRYLDSSSHTRVWIRAAVPGASTGSTVGSMGRPAGNTLKSSCMQVESISPGARCLE